MKIKLFSVLMMLCALVYNANAHMLRNPISATQNDATDNVVGMAMAANGDTYVLQAINQDNITTTSRSLSNNTGTSVIAGNDHGCLIIDKIPAGGGAATLFSRISITGSSYASGLIGGGIIVDPFSGKVYVTGSLFGSMSYTNTSGTLTTKTSSSYDMFVCSFNSSGQVDNYNQQGGTGQEIATSLDINSGNVFVTGYYFTYNTGEQTDFNPGTLVTAPSAANLVNNSFILRFSSSTLGCNQAYGWATLNNVNASVTPKTVRANGSGVFIAGEFTGDVNFGSTNFVASLFPRMFTSRVLISTTPGAFAWAKQEGITLTAPYNGHSSGNAIYLAGADLYVAGSVTATTSTSHSGDADALLIKYSSINGTTAPTVAWEVHSGGNSGDEASAICNDGGSLVITGRMNMSGTLSYTHRTTAGSTAYVTYTGGSGKDQGFVASYSPSGTLNWVRYGESNDFASTAIASSGGCYMAFGGNFNSQSTWDEGTTIGSASPIQNKLFASLLPTKDLVITPTTSPYVMNNGSAAVFTATGATTYNWLAIPYFGGQTLSNSAPTSSSTNIGISSGGFPGSYFEIWTLGFYTVNAVQCTTIVKRRVNQTTYKTDGSEVATSIEDVDQPMFTFNTFPNPTTNKLTISYSLVENAPATLQAVDVLGRVVFEKQVSAQYADETIDTDMWGNGAYIVSIQQNGKIIASKNVLKQ